MILDDDEWFLLSDCDKILPLAWPDSNVPEKEHAAYSQVLTDNIYTWKKFRPQIWNFKFDNQNFSRSMSNLSIVIPI